MKSKNNISEDKFNSKWGFVISCIGSSVGMANIWLFPYRAGEFGGAAFLIPYILFVILIGFTGVIGEMAFGRAMQSGPLGAFKKAFEMKNSRFGSFFGLIPVIGSLGIAIGYSVIIGWILKFLADSIIGNIVNKEDPAVVFTELSRDFGSVPWHLLGLVLVLICMSFGISPAPGYSYLFKPDWWEMADPRTWVYAMGQAFFSLSLAGSGTVVYGSYLKSDVDVVSSARYVSIFDTLAALLSGLVIIPAVFAYGMEPNSGPGLLFITIPSVIRSIPFGQIFAVLFFLAVFFAGATSLVNLLESPVEALQKRLGWSRKASIAAVGAVTAAAGIFVEGDLLSPWMDSISIYVIPLGALLAGITMFWICGSAFARNAVQLGRKRTLGKWFEPMTKYVFCGVAVLVYILGIFFGGIG